MFISTLLFSILIGLPLGTTNQDSGFGGIWQLNREMSEELTGGLSGASYGLIVTVSGPELTIEERTTIRGRTQPAQPRTYRLDGELTTAQVSRPIAGTMELEARRLANGRQLELKSTISGTNEDRPVTFITVELWELIDKGRRLKIRRNREFGYTSTQMVLVFDRT